MKVENLLIERKASYDTDYPNQLVGLVQLKGDNGKMEVKLSPAIVAKIFVLVKEDAERVANYNASQIGQAVDNAAGEYLLSHGDLYEG